MSVENVWELYIATEKAESLAIVSACFVYIMNMIRNWEKNRHD